ncbi:unnamed protein product, partial [Prorocentrum cordatum]
ASSPGGSLRRGRCASTWASRRSSPPAASTSTTSWVRGLRRTRRCRASRFGWRRWAS